MHFLRFIVEQTLLGHTEGLKERLIGIEVFGRTPDYDMSTDSIVRVAAGEIRKRLAQYYVEGAHRNELWIRLQPGSYVPNFQPAVAAVAPEASEDKATESADSSIPLESRDHHFGKGTVAIALSLGTALLLVTMVLIYMTSRPTPIERFWQPLLNSSNSVIICLGDLSDAAAEHSRPDLAGLETGTNSNDYLDLGDVEAMNQISRILTQHGKVVITANSASTKLADLRRQPVVLIGGRTNQWTMRSMPMLRYQLVLSILPGVNGIRDRDDQGRIRWSVDFNVPINKIPMTYAIITRFVDPTTGQPTVIVDGLGAAGTIAGADFLSTPAYLSKFAQTAPNDWDKRNIEVIVQSQLINGDYGPPHVIATHFW